MSIKVTNSGKEPPCAVKSDASPREPLAYLARCIAARRVLCQMEGALVYFPGAAHSMQIRLSVVQTAHPSGHGVATQPLVRGDPINIGILIPTLNAEENFKEFLPALRRARNSFQRVLVLDSCSTDRTREMAARAGFEVIMIDRKDFDHGGTRQLGVEHLSDCDIIVCMTQDAILASKDAIDHLVAPFENAEIAATYGRQLPRVGAGLLEAYSRNFGYSDVSFVKSWPHSKSMGIMAGAVSNSFAAYRRSDLLEVGGFPSNLVCTEDVFVGFKLILNKKKIAYVAESAVHHSHNYTILQEFQRYFDIGAFYCAFEPWILKTAGTAEGRGLLFLKHQLRAIVFKEPWLLPKCILSTITKYLGYRLGANWHRLPLKWRVLFGMNKSFWNRSESLVPIRETSYPNARSHCSPSRSHAQDY